MRTVQLVPGAAYRMPGICCSCGAPAGTGKLRTGGSAGAGKYTISLDFPLCDECAAREKKERTGMGFGWLMALLAGATALSSTSSLPANAGGAPTIVTWALAVAMVVVVARAGMQWLFGGTTSTRWGCLAGALVSIPVGVLLLMLFASIPPKGAWMGAATLTAYIVGVFLGQPIGAFVLGRMGRPVEPVPFTAGPGAAHDPIRSAVRVTKVSKGGAFSQGGMTVVFANDQFGTQFEMLNGSGF